MSNYEQITLFEDMLQPLGAKRVCT
uniref:Uncharacterized protein n=1 Tax=Arundo donax TaxID=35708 RepID=A0A0A9AC31_ARUDO